MKISELSARSGVSIPTLKFYQREGILPKGIATGATTALYDDSHLERIRLITGLRQAVNLPMATIKKILGVIDNPDGDIVDNVGDVINSLPPAFTPKDDYPYARAALERCGMLYFDDYSPIAQLDQAIEAIVAAGMPWTDEIVDNYASAVRQIAVADLSPMAEMSQSQRISFAVLGTAMYEPVITAFRRIAHAQLAVEGNMERPDERAAKENG